MTLSGAAVTVVAAGAGSALATIGGGAAGFGAGVGSGVAAGAGSDGFTGGGGSDGFTGSLSTSTVPVVIVALLGFATGAAGAPTILRAPNSGPIDVTSAASGLSLSAVAVASRMPALLARRTVTLTLSP